MSGVIIIIIKIVIGNFLPLKELNLNANQKIRLLWKIFFYYLKLFFII